MVDYGKLWNDLKQELEIHISKLEPEYRDYVHRMGYAICASPLKSAKILVLGANWGGGEDNNREGYRQMPWANELLANWSFARNFQRCFSEILGSEEKAIYLIWKHTVYTNVCLLRTPNTQSKKPEENKLSNRDIYQKGIEISKPLLMEIIQAVKPEIIICSGNAADNKVATPTAVVSEMTKGNRRSYRINWWEDEGVDRYPVSGSNFYMFERNLEGLLRKVTVLSFPHFSYFNYTLTEKVIQVCREAFKKKKLL